MRYAMRYAMPTPEAPTERTMLALQRAYDHFNATLFDGTLPPVLLTLRAGQVKSRQNGYFRPGAFSDGRERTDELAMNPKTFRVKSDVRVLSTVVHEMVHVWQSHFGTPGRSGWHNVEWGKKMLDVGLHPSNTGQPGGKTVGRKMTHYILPDGAFAREAQALVDGGFALDWSEVAPFQPRPPGGEGGNGGPERPWNPDVDGPPPPQRDGAPGQAPAGSAGREGEPTWQKPAAGRVRLTCQSCRVNAWTKPGVSLICGECRDRMVEVAGPAPRQRRDGRDPLDDDPDRPPDTDRVVLVLGKDDDR